MILKNILILQESETSENNLKTYYNNINIIVASSSLRPLWQELF